MAWPPNSPPCEHKGEEGTRTDRGPLSYVAPELIAACRAEHGPTRTRANPPYIHTKQKL